MKPEMKPESQWEQYERDVQSAPKEILEIVLKMRELAKQMREMKELLNKHARTLPDFQVKMFKGGICETESGFYRVNLFNDENEILQSPIVEEVNVYNFK